MNVTDEANEHGIPQWQKYVRSSYNKSSVRYCSEKVKCKVKYLKYIPGNYNLPEYESGFIMNMFLSPPFLLEEVVNTSSRFSIMLRINPLLNAWLLRMNYILGTALECCLIPLLQSKTTGKEENVSSRFLLICCVCFS